MGVGLLGRCFLDRADESEDFVAVGAGVGAADCFAAEGQVDLVMVADGAPSPIGDQGWPRRRRGIHPFFLVVPSPRPPFV